MTLIAAPPPLSGGTMLARLHAIHAEHGYLPPAELHRAAAELGVPLSQVYSAATFYTAFSFQPRGRYTLQVCQGTACYIRGGDKLLQKLKALLGIEPGETTDDQLFTLEVVHCLGSCSMAPVVRVENVTHGRLKVELLPRILKKCYSVAEARKGEMEP
jgi:NADH-quinone oxidoreductase subunit E